MLISMIGLAAKPGTDVLPTCSTERHVEAPRFSGAGFQKFLASEGRNRRLLFFAYHLG